MASSRIVKHRSYLGDRSFNSAHLTGKDIREGNHAAIYSYDES